MAEIILIVGLSVAAIAALLWAGSLGVQRDAARSHLRVAAGESAALAKDNENLRKKADSAVADAARFCTLVSALESRGGELERGLVSAQAGHDVVLKKLAQLESVNKQQAGMIYSQNAEILDLGENLSRREKERDDWQASWTNLNTTTTGLYEELKKTKESLNHAQADAAGWKDAHDRVYRTYTTYVSESKPKLDNYLNLKETITRLEADVKESDAVADGWKAAYDGEVVKLARAVKLHQELQDNVQRSIQGCEKDVQAWKSSYHQCLAGLNQSQDANLKMAAQIQEQAKAYEELQGEVIRLTRERDQSRKEVGEVRADVGAYKRSYEDLNKQITQTKQVACDYHKALVASEDQLTTTRRGRDDALVRLEVSEKELRQTVKEARNILADRDTYKKLHADALAGHQKANAELQKLLAEVKELRAGYAVQDEFVGRLRELLHDVPRCVQPLLGVPAAGTLKKRVRDPHDYAPAHMLSFCDGSLIGGVAVVTDPTFIHDGYKHDDKLCCCVTCRKARVEADKFHYGEDLSPVVGCACRHCVSKRGRLP